METLLAPTPTPGRFYRILYGDTLFGITSDAYGVGPGPERLEWARVINRSTYNDRFRGDASNFFPEGQVSFYPKFIEAFESQAEAEGACPGGHSFAVLWIPVEPGHEPEVEEDLDLLAGFAAGWTEEDHDPEEEPDEDDTPPVEPRDDAGPLLPGTQPRIPVRRRELNTLDIRPHGAPWISA